MRRQPRCACEVSRHVPRSLDRRHRGVAVAVALQRSQQRSGPGVAAHACIPQLGPKIACVWVLRAACIKIVRWVHPVIDGNVRGSRIGAARGDLVEPAGRQVEHLTGGEVYLKGVAAAREAREPRRQRAVVQSQIDLHRCQFFPRADTSESCDQQRQQRCGM